MNLPEERMFIVVFTYDHMSITSWASAISKNHAINCCLSTVMAECGEWTANYLHVGAAETNM